MCCHENRSLPTLPELASKVGFLVFLNLFLNKHENIVKSIMLYKRASLLKKGKNIVRESLTESEITSFTQYSSELQPQAQHSPFLVGKFELQPCNVKQRKTVHSSSPPSFFTC